MKEHVRILGILHLVFGAIGILIALLFFVIFGLGTLGIAGAAAHKDPDALLAVPIIAAIGTFLVVLIALLSVPGIVAGYGLLNYKPWARILAIVLAAFNLLSVPVGTAIGVYGLWVLLNTETEQMFLGGAAKPAPPSAP
ncbi:MAG: hypothetical protein O2968_07050 [Acidobacteria bacterium]|nr:hypothetical protein [Acidobacteriota bacterium]